MLLEGIADTRAKIIHPLVYIDFSNNHCPVSVMIECTHFQAVIEELLEIPYCITLSESHKNTGLLNSTFCFGERQTLPIFVIQTLKIWQLWKRSFC